jgi:RNA polymerase sigma factor (sigma-70 family)
VNHERARRANKRDGEIMNLTLGSLDALPGPAEHDLLAVHEALQAFEAIDLRAARAVELRYFGGLEQEEIAELLGVSLATVKRDLSLATAWLRRELAG